MNTDTTTSTTTNTTTNTTTMIRLYAKEPKITRESEDEYFESDVSYYYYHHHHYYHYHHHYHYYSGKRNQYKKDYHMLMHL